MCDSAKARHQNQEPVSKTEHANRLITGPVLVPAPAHRPGAKIARLRGGGRNKFWGGMRSLFMRIREGHGGTRNLFQSGSNKQGEDQKNNNNKGLQFINFHKFWLTSQNSCDFLRILKWRPKKKKKRRSSSQQFYEIRCEYTKIMKIRAVNTNLGVLGLDSHSNSLEPVNFFGAQSSLGGAQFSFGGAQAVIRGARPRNAPPVAPGLPAHYWAR